MMIPSGLVLFLLLVAFVLSALSYYKINPERVIVSRPFVLMATPLLLFVVFLALSAEGALAAFWSVVCLLVALGVLGVAMHQARCLLPKGR
jgi:hypothetical protein